MLLSRMLPAIVPPRLRGPGALSSFPGGRPAAGRDRGLRLRLGPGSQSWDGWQGDRPQREAFAASFDKNAEPMTDVSATNTLPPFRDLTGAQWSILWRFADRLGELGYTEGNVTYAMSVQDHCIRNFRAWPAHVRSCRRLKEKHSFALLAAFFLIEESVTEPELVALFDAEIVRLLVDLGLIGISEAGTLYFRFYLYPLLGSYILTDGALSNPQYTDQVYYLGTDSHMLARLTPRFEAEAILDHCTGSGVHAILGAGHCKHSFGLDINRRALEFARFNARLNRRADTLFLESNCYQNVHESSLGVPPQFDLITANPPFVPAPEKLAHFREGGATGEEVTERIVRGLPRHLSASGVFSMITNIPTFGDHTFFERCEAWLASDETWGMAVLSNLFWTPISYILAQHAPVEAGQYGAYFQRWLDSYEKVGLQAVSASQVYLFRSPHPWRIDRKFGHPKDSVAPFIGSWISSLRSFTPDTAQLYRLHPGVDKMRWTEDLAEVFVEWKPEYHWWRPEGQWLDGEAATLLRTVRNQPVVGSSCSVDGLTRLLEHHLVTQA